MATPTPEAKKRGAVGGWSPAAPCFLLDGMIDETKRCPRTESVSEACEAAEGPISTAGPEDVTRTPRSV